MSGRGEVLRLVKPHSLFVDMSVWALYHCVASYYAFLSEIRRFNVSSRAGVINRAAHALEKTLRLIYPLPRARVWHEEVLSDVQLLLGLICS